MSVIARFDIRTLLACQLLLAFVFSLVFFAMKLAYRNLKGVGSLAAGFLIGVPGIFLLTSRGLVPPFVSVVIANTLIYIGYLLMYRCILRFHENRHGKDRHTRAKLLYAVGLVVAMVLFITWFSMVQDNIVYRIVALCAVSSILFLMMAQELMQQAAGRISLRLFAAYAVIHALTTVYRIVFTILNGAPQDFMQHDSVQALSMTIAILSVSLLGVFFLMLVSGELTMAVEHLANHDPLTGILNRHGIESILATELDRSGRNGRPLSAVLIDVDKFKSINDAGGHAAGDVALRTVAHGIASSLRSYDLLGRFGGDEFLLLLPETSAAHALEVANRIRTLLAVSAEVFEPALRPTVSIGVAETLSGDTPATLLARADAALYDAKLAGRNCVRRRYRSGIHPVAGSPTRDILGATAYETTEIM